MQILSILWADGTATVKKVHDALSDNNQTGYTTTLKIM
ncbi:MAG: BlaI/MecI/CopY family transcriptional regulator [Cyclobacteriaceae bacterium]|nr:BlaI/MecI/CopY family transcriptional regulator [Cyclobacteriaceae bacterium]